MKKIFAQILILALFVVFASCPKATAKTAFEGFKTAEVQKSSYPKYNNDYEWESVVTENTSFRLYYKTAQEQGIEYITEMYYVLEKAGEKIVLASFSVKNGFRDRFGNQLNHAYEKYLRGLSLDSALKSPFFVHAIYENRDTGELYETEIFIMLTFDGENRTLMNWSPW